MVGGDADAGRGARGEQRGARVGVCGGRDDGSVGAAPLFSSDRFAPPDAERLNLIDLLADRKDKLYVGLGAASAVLAAESVVVVVKRFLLDET